MSSLSFTAKPYKIKNWTIVRIPQDISANFSSRGMMYADITCGKMTFEAPLEPDGQGSHWFQLTNDRAALNEGTFTVKPRKDWAYPDVPKDLKAALQKSSQAAQIWKTITPAAQWEWVRWMRATNNEETRQRRIRVAISKLEKGTRRPCCFNRNACTIPEVSKKWVLIHK